jgi:hypothetical protein
MACHSRDSVNDWLKSPGKTGAARQILPGVSGAHCLQRLKINDILMPSELA